MLVGPFRLGRGREREGEISWHVYASGHVHAHMLARVSLPILDLFALERVFFMVMVRTCVRGVGCGGCGGRGGGSSASLVLVLVLVVVVMVGSATMCYKTVLRFSKI